MNFPLFSFAHALNEFVPFIVRWLGGEQSEKVAHKVVEVAHSLTGEKDPQNVIKVLKADPKLALQFQEAILKINYELEMAEYKNQDSARLRDLALVNAGRSNLRADIMVISVAFGLVSCLIMITLFRMSLPGEAVGIISTIAGFFGSCLKDAYAFEFGSFRGSKLKDTKFSTLFLSKYSS